MSFGFWNGLYHQLFQWNGIFRKYTVAIFVVAIIDRP